MNYKEVVRKLKQAGTTQNIKVYRKHGVKNGLFGVSCAELNKLCKKIKTDHTLAQELWSSKNHDAQVLATMIAVPSQMTKKLLNQWVKDLDNYVIKGYFSILVSKTPFAKEYMQKWITVDKEWISSCGWDIVCHLAMKRGELTQNAMLNYLKIIEKNIHYSKNRVRHCMNSALIAMGIQNDILKKEALAIAKRIGKVEVDHGETSCKTPDAAEYILRTAKRRRKASC